MTTPRLGLPFLSAGQAQKEITHNEALQILDVIAGGAVEDGPGNTPPASPAPGAAYIVGSAPTGVWAGKPQCVAAYTGGGWRFVPPVEGLNLHVKASGATASFAFGAWEVGVVRGTKLVVNGQQVVGSRRPAIPDASGGTTVDTQARQALAQVLSALRQHGLIEP